MLYHAAFVFGCGSTMSVRDATVMVGRREMWMRGRGLLGLWILMSVASCGGNGGEESGDGGSDAPPAKQAGESLWGDDPARVLLVTLDTTRADRIGAYGYEAAETPWIDDLARGGVTFRRAYAPTPITLPSHTSILTGVLPIAHGVRDNGLFVLNDDARLLPEVLREYGWRTGAFVGTYVLHPDFGVGQGFEAFTAPVRGDFGDAGQAAERPAREVVDDAIDWLSSLDGDASYFVWLHFYDPHAPYRPPDGVAEGDDPYDAEITYCDRELARLEAFLKKGGLADGLVTILTADHGESLGEHGEDVHGVFVYDSTMRVPLIAHGPFDESARGKTVDRLVNNAAIPSTVMTLAGIPADEMAATPFPTMLTVQGALPPETSEAVYLESRLPLHSYSWHPYRALVYGDDKLILGKEEELYAIEEDPGESHDLQSENRDTVEALTQRLTELEDSMPALGWVKTRELSADERARLESLGYQVGDADVSLDPDKLKDARERIGDLKVYSQVRQAMVQARNLQMSGDAAAAQEARSVLARARNLLRAIEEENPHDPQLATHLGTIEFALGRYSAALPYLEHAVTTRIDPTTRFNLGMCYQQTGRMTDAAEAMMRCVTEEPRHIQSQEWLVWYYSQGGEYGIAVWWLRRLLDQLPSSDPRAMAHQRSLAQLESQMNSAGQSPEPPPEFGS